MKEALEKLKSEVQKKLQGIQTLQAIDEYYRQVLGRQGRLRAYFNQLKVLPVKERVQAGKVLNQLKKDLEALFAQARQDLSALPDNQATRQPLASFDPTLPGTRRPQGRLHPLTRVQQQVVGIFERMGFSVAEGPYLETEFYNFDALNIPANHPARDLWDTFWLKPTNNKQPTTANGQAAAQTARLLLRTHTSPVQVRFMESHNPPVRVVVPGRCFRHDNPDATHNFEFYQLEGLVVDQAGRISAAHLKWTLQVFFKHFFGKPLQIRFLPDYFPFTEPSFEISIRLQGQKQWLELAGAGMVHPKVFEHSGLNPAHWQGFAFGVGLDRLAMLKYKVDDVRIFYSNDLRILRGFR